MTTRDLWHPAHRHGSAFRAPVALDRLTASSKGVLDTLRAWNKRARERAQLGGLDDRMLRDIGITRTDALFLSSRPFWKE